MTNEPKHPPPVTTQAGAAPAPPRGGMTSGLPPASAAPTTDVPAAVEEEEKVLGRVVESLRARVLDSVRRDYDTELIALRDELAEARLEDAPPLLAQMERLQAVAARRSEVTTGVLDARCPYFAHMRLLENGRARDVCLGRSTYLDPDRGVRVVDWRNAPVSRIYYRYGEGDPYEESFGDKIVEGEVVVRRDVTISGGRLMRVGGGDATHVRRVDGTWRTQSARSTRLAGGQGTAVLPRERGVLGSGEGEDGIGRRDRFLPEIAALLDPKQFEAISRPTTGVVVIQGGAGSGKTTIGLHRIAYLAFQAPRRFTPDRVLVVVPSRALATYTSRVLPALDVPNVPVVTLSEWQNETRRRAFPTLPTHVTNDAPHAVTRLKKHPAFLALLERRVDELVASIDGDLRAAIAAAPESIGRPILEAWELLAASPLSGRVAGVRRWLAETLSLPGARPPPPPSAVRVPIDHALTRAWRRGRDVASLWADLLTDRQALMSLVAAEPSRGVAPLTRVDVAEALRWCIRRCEVVLTALGGGEGVEKLRREQKAGVRDPGADEGAALDEALGGDGAVDDAGALDEGSAGPTRRSKRPLDDEARPAHIDDDGDDELDFGRRDPIDGRPIDEEEALGPALDPEDDAILLRLHQRLRGPLQGGKGKAALSYEHVFVDEVQDCAAIDLAVLVACTNVVGGERSMTLAGDTAQRLTLDVGLGEFAPALEALGLPHVEVEPLTIGYRSTRQVLELAREVLGPLAPEVVPIATRDGAPIEKHRFNDPGAAAAFLAGALRDLASREPLASVVLITRHPWQAEIYYEVLRTAEIPNLRRVRDQDFPFRAGVDLTDVRQVKGLEWDYVVLLDVNAGSYPEDDEARHLLHIAATRAAHQLWLVTSGDASPLVGNWED